MVQDEVSFYGHPNVLSLHAKTIEVTKEERLSLRGDCIIGVNADKGCAGLNEQLKGRLRHGDSVVRIEIIVGNKTFQVKGSGDARLSLLNKHDIVIRRTNYTCPRTVSVQCNKASSDIPREIVGLLQTNEAKGLLRLIAE